MEFGGYWLVFIISFIFGIILGTRLQDRQVDKLEKEKQELQKRLG